MNPADASKTIIIDDCCEYCKFHVRSKIDSDHRFCNLHNRQFNIDELFDEDSHHQLRPDWCDAISIEIKNGWRDK